MRSNSPMMRILVFGVTACLVAPTLYAQAVTTASPLLPQDKLSVRLKAKLPDYKGPSRFMGRKALITYSPDGRLVAMSGTKRTITVWDTETGELKATLKAGKDGVSGFAFSPDGGVAATRDFLDKSVRLWDTNTWEVKATLPGRKRDFETKLKSGFSFEEEFGPVPISPDGQTLLSEREDDIVAISQVADGKEQAALYHDTRDSGAKEVLKVMLFGGTRHFLALQAGYSSDGRFIFTINGDKQAKIWDSASGQLKHRITNNERIYRASFTPDNASLLTVEQQGGMKLWDVETGQLKGQIAPKNFLEDFMKSFEMSADGKNIATFYFGDTRIWDAKTAELRFKLPKSETTDAMFSPDGRWLATASKDKQSSGKIWNVETAEMKFSLAPTGYKSASVVYSPDGRLIATTNDKGVNLWDAETGELLATLGEARYPVAFSKDGRTMVTGARNDTALLWELKVFPSSPPA
jgi:WD40 repeat protein